MLLKLIAVCVAIAGVTVECESALNHPSPFDQQVLNLTLQCKPVGAKEHTVDVVKASSHIEALETCVVDILKKCPEPPSPRFVEEMFDDVFELSHCKSATRNTPLS
ncbi:uncharacterized protein LOC114353123, partial [Ostrinia furnacalis]|uniref:uncharacterized protein LOC114353123 n=1 Tax=Ostrinia furnacalis TaxID=93504 RepID=UPI00103B9D32